MAQRGGGLPRLRLGSQSWKAFSETSHWCCSHQGFLKTFLSGCLSPASTKRRGQCRAGLFASHVDVWSGLWNCLLLEMRREEDWKGQEGWNGTEKLAGTSCTFAVLTRAFKRFVRSAWHGPVNHRILRAPSETCLWGRVPASPPPGHTPCRKGINSPLIYDGSKLKHPSAGSAVLPGTAGIKRGLLPFHPALGVSRYVWFKERERYLSLQFQ